jgi:hypothetical protein
MAAPRRLRNLNLDTSNANLEGEGHENPEGNENDESLQDPPNIDGFMDNLTNQPKSPIKIICEFQVFSLQCTDANPNLTTSYMYAKWIYAVSCR